MVNNLITLLLTLYMNETYLIYELFFFYVQFSCLKMYMHIFLTDQKYYIPNTKQLVFISGAVYKHNKSNLKLN